MYVNVYADCTIMHVCKCIGTYACIYVHASAQQCMYVNASTRMHVYTCVDMHVRV